MTQPRRLRVLLLGAGAREHALAWRLSMSPLLEKLWCAPGNPGIGRTCEVLPHLSATDTPGLLKAARDLAIDLVVVGPEAPLVAGVADALAESGVPVFGPGARAAAIEGSKAFAKAVMLEGGIATASAEVFDDPVVAEAAARARGDVVVKVDGLAAGKGVIVAVGPDEAAAAVRQLWPLCGPGGRLLLEERLAGEEVSVIALCDGERYVLLPPAQDHKRLLDGDAGPNTGGMGAYAPAWVLSADQLKSVGETVIRPALEVLRARGAPFRGALYAGLMCTENGPKVLEFNCRLGDPEAQALMLVLRGDLLAVLDACARGRLDEAPALESTGEYGVAVVMAAAGYPSQPRLGDLISGVEGAEAIGQVFHAGTSRGPGDGLLTAGGRVLTVCGTGSTAPEARARAYQAVSRITFSGAQVRGDIGARAR